MNGALDILDAHGEMGVLASHLDMVLCSLESRFGVDEPATGGAHDLRAALEKKLFASSAAAAE